MPRHAVNVAITAVGVTSAAGRGLDALGAALLADRCCGQPYRGSLPLGSVARVEVPVIEPHGFEDDRRAALAFDALDQLDPSAWTGARTGVWLGAGLSSVTPRELEEDLFRHVTADGSRFDRAALAADLEGRRATAGRHRPERVTEAVALRAGALGPVRTSFSACAAAAQAMAEGLWAVRRGQVDVAIVGGHDAMAHPLGLLSFVVLGALSPATCRPFDRRRDGFMLGEGAAIFVLESSERAARRGVRPLAWLLGGGTSVDAHAATAPHPEGLGAERAMRAALDDAGLRPADVGYVNAHGTGTPVGDVAEAKAVERVFGPTVAMSSIKGAIGHTVAAAGAVEAAGLLACWRQGALPGTVGLQEPDPAVRVRVLGPPVHESVRAVVSNSFGFGGQNCALVFGSPDA